MKLNEQLQSKLSKLYEPSSMIEMQFRGKDLAFKTDEAGHAILLFIGRKDANGQIKGERYARTLKRDRNGLIIKDHWELKGKAT
jgi:hypothetical protein